MGFADKYLAKHSLGTGLIDSPPNNRLKIIAVIPAYSESGLINCLDSLFSCHRPNSAVEVIVIINWPFHAGEKEIAFNKKIAAGTTQWSETKNSKSFTFHILCLPGQDKKNSGVGFARKRGMDEAIHRFNILDKPDGVILSLDADTLTENNYFTAIEDFYSEFADTDACNIRFAHPLSGSEDKYLYQGIAEYELHMRYYLQGLRYAGHPNSFHTVGSAFSIKASCYCRQGGMNKRAAGEDFYFLQKVFDAEKFGECNTSCVYPSPRSSGRVPFGTGAAIKTWLERKTELQTFHPGLFEILKAFLNRVPLIYNYARKGTNTWMQELPPVLHDFLVMNNFEEKVKEIFHNSSGQDSFNKRFFRWFNMFRALKFMNHAKSVYPNRNITEAAGELLKKKGVDHTNSHMASELLKKYRDLEME